MPKIIFTLVHTTVCVLHFMLPACRPNFADAARATYKVKRDWSRPLSPPPPQKKNLRAANRTAIPPLSSLQHRQSSLFLSCFILKIAALAYSKRGLTIYQSARRDASQNLQHHCENLQVPRDNVIATVSDLDILKMSQITVT